MFLFPTSIYDTRVARLFFLFLASQVVSPPVKPHINSTFIMASYARENDANVADINMDDIYASGGFKNVYRGRYAEGPRIGEECVGKIFKSGSVFEESYFANEMKVVNKALDIVNRFNRDRIIDKHVWMNMPSVWTFCENSARSGEKILIEPLITNFEKFNSNTGWTPRQASPWINVMQALSHYSYHCTNGQLLFCDLQGGIYQDGFVITDPVIMSMNQEYGPTDLGSEGIATFFNRHRCNEYCRRSWILPAHTKSYFPAQKGSAMVIPTRSSRTPLTGRVRSSGLQNQALGMIYE